MSEVTGFVQAINQKQTSFGTMYDVVINGTKYGIGKFAPKGINQGDYVKFTSVQKGNYFNVAPGSLSKQAAPAGVSPAKPAMVSSGGGSIGGDTRQEVISRQAAANTAIEFVKVLQQEGALPIPKSVKSDKKADLMEAMLIEYIAKFYKLATRQEFEIPEDLLASTIAAAEEADTNWNE